MLKRTIDLAISALALLLLSPIFCAAVATIWLTSAGPALFRQSRVGRHGRIFDILKFRTMHMEERPIRAITVGRDPRITRVGHVLRQTKVDELPQLINVLRGDMSLVGPRPEVPQYVALYSPELYSKVLSVRPGITDRSSIKYRHEAAILARQSNPEKYYISVVLPDKLRIAADYVDNVSFIEDVRILFDTARAVFFTTSQHR